LGGTPSDFHVSFVKDRHFRFSVASRFVGFDVYAHKRIITAHFDVYFHLWRDGGANWKKELDKWKREEEASWQKVSPHKRKVSHIKRVSFARKLIQDSPEKKSTPPELNPGILDSNQNIKLGSFSCGFDFAPSLSTSGESSNSNSNSNLVPMKLVFGRLKQDLGKSRLVSSSGQYRIEGSNGGENKVTYFRCMREGHLARECSNPVRCWGCHMYGHKLKNCFRSRATCRLIWKLKETKQNGATNTEPGAEATEKTKACSGPAATMANFVVDPLPFTPASVFIEDGGPHR
jgi:hypothetical protein